MRDTYIYVHTYIHKYALAKFKHLSMTFCSLLDFLRHRNRSNYIFYAPSPMSTYSAQGVNFKTLVRLKMQSILEIFKMVNSMYFLSLRLAVVVVPKAAGDASPLEGTHPENRFS